MNDMLIHPQTDRHLAAFVERPSHAVLIVGPAGSGKMTMAISLAESVLALEKNRLNTYGYAKTLSPVDDKAIGIDVIRELEMFLSLKVPIDRAINRTVIIENSHKLTVEAQNALLKLLEEPPKGTVIILTANHSQLLLPTIRSRVQTINLTKPDKDEINTYFSDQKYQSDEIQRAYSVSGGLPGLMSSMLGDEEHPLTKATEWARKLLAQNLYERLLVVDELSKQRQLALDTTYILKQMAHVSLQTASGKSAHRWRSILKASYEANEGLSGNGNAKLILTKLMLSI